MSNYRISYLDLVSSRADGGKGPLDPPRVLSAILLLLVVSNVAVAVALVFSVQLGGRVSWNGFVDALFTSPWADVAEYFTTRVGDCVFVAAATAVLLPAIAWCAIRSSINAADDADDESEGAAAAAAAAADSSRCCACFRCHYGIGTRRTARRQAKYRQVAEGDDRQAPLLDEPSGAVPAEVPPPPPPPRASVEGFEAEDRAAAKDRLARKGDEAYLTARARAGAVRTTWLTALYVVGTLLQVYLGLKCVSFEFHDEAREGTLMAMGVVAITLIVNTLKELVDATTKETGELIPQVHPHRLHLVFTVAGHWCDQCGTIIKGGRAYRCKLCDFDLCMVCLRKGEKGLAVEGQLRGDRGARAGSGGDDGQTRYFMRAFALVKAEWRLFTAAIACLLLDKGLALFSPSYQGKILDAIVRGDRSSFTDVVLTYMVIGLTSGAFSAVKSIIFSTVGRRLANTLRVQLYKGIVIQDVAYFDGNSTGKLTSRLSNDVGAMVTPIQSMVGTVLGNAISLVGGVLFCFYTSWRLSMLAFITIGPLSQLTAVYAVWSQDINRQIFSALAEANGYATQALSNIRTVKAFSMEHAERDKFEGAVLVTLHAGIKDSFASAGMSLISSYLDLFTGVLILWYGGLLAMNNKDGLSPGKLITYQLYWNMMVGAFKGLLDILTSFTRAGGAASRVFNMIDSLPDIDIDSGFPVTTAATSTTAAPSDADTSAATADGGIRDLKGAIEMRGVCFAYQMRPDAQVLTDVSLTVPAASVCAIVGKSGGGKSTLINLILRFYDPTSGQVLVDGRDMRSLRLRDVRRHIGVVMQSTELFGGTVLENLTYGLREDEWTREAVVEAATKACAHEFIKNFPEGYSTRVGDHGVRLSGGQRQRLAIARVFLRKPKILLLDEATSSLDAESEAKVQEAIDRLIAEGGSTVILVAHRLSTVVNAHQIVVVSGGHVVEQGNHESLLAAGGAYANLVAKQLQKAKQTISEH